MQSSAQRPGSNQYRLMLASLAFFIGVPVFAQNVPDPPATTNTSSIELQAMGGSVGFGLTDKLRGSVLLARFTEIDATYAQAGVTHFANPSLIYGADHIVIDPDQGSAQHSLRGHVTLAREIRDLRFDVRTAVAYRFENNEVTERWRGRMRFRATYEPSKTSFRYSVYASVEPNYDFSAEELQQTNYSIGFKPWLTDRSNLDLSYIFVDSNSGSDLNLIALTLNWELD